MNKFFYLLIFPFLLVAVRATSQDSISVYLFLHDECVISQNYTALLNRLHGEYGEEIAFVGLFPNFSSKPDKIEAFRQKYHITFPLKTDYYKTITKAMGATVTPEVVIYDHTTGQKLYQGRIDDTYFRVGKRRTVTTTSELEDALRAIRAGEQVPVSETDAVGCFINLRELN